jgi:biopolymer transport protein ExbB
VELARSESDRSLEAAGADLRRGLSVLASVGSVAPFVGLLGTVIGIIGAFQGIASTGSGGLGAVSAGIAEALIETAFGLMVAIPAVLLFNWLTTRINTIELTLSRSAGELLDEIENNHGREASSVSTRKAA